MQIYTDFQNMIFFQVIFDFRFFRIFDGFKIYFLFSLFLFLYSSFSVPLSVSLLLSVPFLIHYDIYYIYQYSITFYPAIIAIIASVPGFTALQILQPCSRSDGRAEPAQYFIYLYYIMHNTTAILYAANYAILINHKKIKNISKKA